MGRNIGLHLARNGWRVAWLGRDAHRLARTERWLGRRLRKLSGEALGFFLAGDDGPLPRVEWVVEAIEEDAHRKVSLLAQLEPRLPAPSPRLLSTTSSILPEQLHPDLSVAHFFYPLEYTRLVELIPGPGLRHAEADAVAATLEQTGLLVVRQDRDSAFFLNRLLLPLQASCFGALFNGASAEEVDLASAASPLCPNGQLSLMDSVGLDVVAAAVDNYMGRMIPEQANTCAPLQRGLRLALEQGRLGNKNGAGLLCGEPMVWQPEPMWAGDDPGEYPRLMFQACASVLDQGWVDGPTLDEALVRLYGAETTVATERERLNRE